MKALVSCTVAALLVGVVALADNTTHPAAAHFVRSVIESLLEGGTAVPFDMAEEIIAFDNGEVITAKELRAAWPAFAKSAFKKEANLDAFLAGVDIRLSPVADNKRVMSNKRLMSVYEHQLGDLYCDASHMKGGGESPVGYEKAFIYIIRKVDGKWRLIGIGG